MGEKREGGTLEAEVKGATAEQAWPFFDFSNLHKFSPAITSCVIVDGVSGEPGCVRYCETAPGEGGFVMRVKEKLLAIDHAKKSFGYEAIENNIEAVGYRAHVKLAGDKNGGCRVKWEFSAESFGVSTKDAIGQFLQVVLQGIVKSIEEGAVKGEA